MNTSPQGKPEEKKETPWRVQFTRKKQPTTYYEAEKDLLTACWGNQKMAGVLYHFLYVGSWRARNTNVPENVRTYILQESHQDIRDKLKLKISEPTLISFLKLFAQVGYVQKAARKQALEINFEAVEKAFTNPPDKPILDENLSSNLNLNANLKQERDEEVERLHLEVEKLTSQVQDLSLTLVRFSSLCAQIEREFKFNFSSPTKKLNLNLEAEAALEALANAQNDPEGNLIEYRDREEIESKRVSNSAIAPSPAHTLALVEDNFFFEDTPEQANFAYSHDKPQTTTLQVSPETSIPAESGGYRQESMPIDPPVKPTKRTSRQKVEQQGLPLQVDLGPLVMPANDAPWNASTAVIVSEVLREKRYTPMQRDNQINTAKRMVKSFPDMTRAQFEEVFADWAKWWREHDKGFFTLADLMCKGKNNEVRLQSALDRLEAQKSKPATSTPSPSQTPQRTRASSPNAAGVEVRVSEEKKQSNIERWKALQAEKRAKQAEQEKLQQAAI